MKKNSLFVAAVLASSLALSSGALAGEMGAKDKDSPTMGSQGMDQSSGMKSGGMDAMGAGEMDSRNESAQATRSGSASSANTAQIREVQEELKDKGYYEQGNVDGILGPRTASAVRKFQQDQGLDATGNLNDQTLRALGVSGQEEFGVSPEFGADQKKEGSDMGMEKDKTKNKSMMKDKSMGMDEKKGKDQEEFGASPEFGKDQGVQRQDQGLKTWEEDEKDSPKIPEDTKK